MRCVTIETELSDFHNMKKLQKVKSDINFVSKNKSIHNLMFLEESSSKVKDLLPNNKSLKGFQGSGLQISNSFALIKTRYLRTNCLIQNTLIIISTKQDKH